MSPATPGADDGDALGRVRAVADLEPGRGEHALTLGVSMVQRQIFV